MTQTTRRSSKMTTHYQRPTLARVYEKVSGACLGYLAEPDQPRDEHGNVKPWHQVTCDERGEWHCTCEGNTKWHRTCRHIRAVQDSCKLRVEAGLPGCFQGKATADVETVEQRKATIALPVTKTAPRQFEDWDAMEQAQTPAQATAAKMAEEAPGTLSSAAKGSFLTACFGNSPAMKQYRDEYIAARRAI